MLTDHVLMILSQKYNVSRFELIAKVGKQRKISLIDNGNKKKRQQV